MPLPAGTVALLDECYALVGAVASEVDDSVLLRASGCAGWNAADLLVHMLLDVRRALVTMATPVAGPADTDAVSYWRPDRAASADEPSAQAHAQHVRRLTVAYSRPASIVREWRDTAPAAVRAVAAGGAVSRAFKLNAAFTRAWL